MDENNIFSLNNIKILKVIDNKKYISTISRECELTFPCVTRICKIFVTLNLIYFRYDSNKKVPHLTEKGRNVRSMIFNILVEIKK